MFESYHHYFNIDPEYFPAVNEKVINENPDLWKKYYPHETFVKLIKDTISVLSRKQKVSIWVEGAYGTGKSHAVLTLKKLLDASAEETQAYFSAYPEQLDNDLYQQFQHLKEDNKIITVHRYGSSSIHGDNSLVFALQESIEQALKANGLEHRVSLALRDAAVAWLSQSWAKDAVNHLIQEQYADLFGGDDVDAIIQKLQTYTGDSLITLMRKVSTVGEENHFKALALDIDGLIQWIKDVIRENDLKAIVFIWDEFTNYFENNLKALTGFQHIAEISETEPFYLMIVTHKSEGLFSDTDEDKQRILDRFMKPTCKIELPENMAFRLMGTAMVKKEDVVIRQDWNETVDELYDRTSESRKLVQNIAKISDEELKNILPIHPYAALLLKHISSAFDSNQRSMFDFIKNDRGDEIKGFQWFINHYGPLNDNPLLTIDMLWDFFYEKGKEYLSPEIRAILDCYPRAVATKKLDDDEQRILKTVLLLQAISQNVKDSVDLFIATEKHLDRAFEGSDLENGASRIAHKLCRDEVLYYKSLGENKYQFSALMNASNIAEIKSKKQEILENLKTKKLIEEGTVTEAIELSGPLKLRYEIHFLPSANFTREINILRNKETENGKIVAVAVLAKDDAESAAVSKLIAEAVKNESYHIVFIDASKTPFGHDAMEQYAEAKANEEHHLKRDGSLSGEYQRMATAILEEWRKRIADGDFVVSYADTDENIVQERVSTAEQLYQLLFEIDKKKFENSLETGLVSALKVDMWTGKYVFQTGVECGVSQKIKGVYASSNLADYIGADAWNQPEDAEPYWIAKPYLLISKIKLQVIATIEEAFQKDGRVSIAEIYNDLKKAPFGFMPCNLTAFVMGFVLKEYLDGTYSWSDNLTSDTLTIVKLKEMIKEIIDLQNTPNPRYRNKYIVKLTDEEKAFNETSSLIFNIPLNECTNIEQTRERIRNKMKTLAFPIWTLKHILADSDLSADTALIEQLIDLYSGIANNQNMFKNKTDSDIAMSIGKLCIQNPYLARKLKSVLTTENCIEGMKSYLKQFEDGILLRLADEIGDNGKYISVLKSKFDADAANWVWNLETAEQKIKEVILEYQIISKSNKVISKTTSFRGTVHEWCDKCSYIRISYEAGKNYFKNIDTEFLSLLHQIKKSGEILDSQKQKFYDLLTENLTAFQEFYHHQMEVFKETCQFYLEQYDFSDAEIEKIYKEFPTNCFTREKSDYFSLVEAKLKEFNAQRGSDRLKALWIEKTGTVSPKEWSDKYQMPILCMIADYDMQKAKEAFRAVNHHKSDSETVEKAIAFLENADFFDRLNQPEERDKAFRTAIIKGYSEMLPDIEEVKKYLSRVLSAEPYEWVGLSEVDKNIQKMAKAKYDRGGYEKALEKIDNMDADSVKCYLKELIKDNMTVGIEILKKSHEVI